MFHMGWFLGYGFGVYGFGGPWTGNIGRDAANPQLFVDMATSLERAGFDYLMLEDSSVLPDVYGGGFDYSVRQGTVRMDPMPLVPLLAAATRKLGIIATANTTFYPPFLAARLFRTLDHVTQGRVGVNLVTGSPHAAAQNYGLDKLYEHDQRYRIADEWMTVVEALWNSWEPDAVVADDPGAGMFADPAKVHYVNFEGEFFRSRGPLNTIPSPQQKPVVCQAGGSPAGRDLAAKHADTVIATAPGVEAMKEYRDDISERMIKFGRDPKDAKVLFLINPVLGETTGEAQAKAARIAEPTDDNLRSILAGVSYVSGFDMASFELDAPLADLSASNGHQSMVKDLMKVGEGKTLREALMAYHMTDSVKLVGTPDDVADEMGKVMDYVGGDGYLIGMPVTRRNITEICDGLAPALRARGLIRSEYEHATFRENLLAY
jgi:FMN-dependent oxidoreductase (nitrilotriacetate monooxygenase family)